MSQEMTIDLGGRKLISTDLTEQPSGEVFTVSKYDDGTEIRFTQKTDGSIDVKCNKHLELQPDGKTVKIIG